MDFLTPELLMSFVTLSMLEIVLGIDNLIFIALVVQNLPKAYAKKARFIGLGLALGIRIVMLMGVAWIMGLTKPLFTVFEMDVSFKDLLLIGGGIFLIAKATFEMHADIAGIEEKREIVKVKSGFAAAIMQIALIDFVFSFDSIITAVGITTHIPVIVAAVVVSMIVMLLASGYISDFLHQYPTFKMLALSFILMIGTLLVAEGLHFHVPRGYIYFAFTFSILVEILNTVASKKRKKQMEADKK